MVNEVKVEHVLILAIVAFLLYHFIGRCRCNGFRVGGQEDLEEDLEEFLKRKMEENKKKNWEGRPDMATLVQEECGIEKYQIAVDDWELEKCNEQVMMLKNKMKFMEKQGDADEDCDDKISKIVAEVDQAWEARFTQLLDPRLGEELQERLEPGQPALEKPCNELSREECIILVAEDGENSRCHCKGLSCNTCMKRNVLPPTPPSPTPPSPTPSPTPPPPMSDYDKIMEEFRALDFSWAN